VVATAQENAGYFRLHRAGDKWLIQSPEGSNLDVAPPTSKQRLNRPFLASVPLVAKAGFADVFDSGFQQELRARTAEAGETFRKDRQLVAFIFTEIPDWGRAWVSWFRSLPEESEGKQQYLLFLKETYGYNIGDLNAAYGLDSTSFTDLAIVNWRLLDLGRVAVRKDDEAFLSSIAQVLCRTASDGIRSRDKDHVILGPLFFRDCTRRCNSCLFSLARCSLARAICTGRHIRQTRNPIFEVSSAIDYLECDIAAEATHVGQPDPEIRHGLQVSCICQRTGIHRSETDLAGQLGRNCFCAGVVTAIDMLIGSP